MRRAWERSFHAVFFGGAAGKTQRRGRYLPWRGGRGCVGAFFRTRRAGGGWLSCGHDGQEGGRLSCGIPCAGSMGNGRICVSGRFPQRHAGRGSRCRRRTRRAALPLRAARGRGAAVRSRQAGRRFFRVDGDRRSGRGVFPRRHAGRGVSAEGVVGRWAALPLRTARACPSGFGRRCFCARRGDCRQAMSGDGAGSAEEVAAGGAVGVPCG